MRRKMNNQNSNLGEKKKKMKRKHVEIFASVEGKSEFERQKKAKVICTETKSPVDENWQN